MNDVAATLGQTTSRRNRHFVNLEARVRVGSQAVRQRQLRRAARPTRSTARAAINLPLEATPRIARRAAWLVTDSAYKEALIQLRAKLEARKAGGDARPTDVPAWTTEKPVVSEEPVLVPPLESLDELETRAKALSAVFRDQPAPARLARRDHQLPRAPLVPHHRGHERHRHAPRERRRDRRGAARPTTASCSTTTSCATATPRRTCRATTSSRPRRRSSASRSPRSRRRR